MMKHDIYLGLGSNIGDRLSHLRIALGKLAALDRFKLLKLSPVYRTEPVGYEAQDDFYNMVVKVETSLNPLELLTRIKEIETDMGRVERVHKGPRVIDIDILVFGDELLNEYKLIIPHQGMLEREFVLRPLSDLEPDLWIAPLHISVGDALSKIEGQKRVVKLKENIELGEVI